MGGGRGNPHAKNALFLGLRCWLSGVRCRRSVRVFTMRKAGHRNSLAGEVNRLEKAEKRSAKQYRNRKQSGTVVPQSEPLSTKKRDRERSEKLQQVVQGSSDWRVGAELLAQADQHKGGQQAVNRASHVALSGQRIRCAIATRFAAVGRPGGPTFVLSGRHNDRGNQPAVETNLALAVNPLADIGGPVATRAALNLTARLNEVDPVLAGSVGVVDEVHLVVSRFASASLTGSHAPMIPISEPLARGHEKILRSCGFPVRKRGQPARKPSDRFRSRPVAFRPDSFRTSSAATM